MTVKFKEEHRRIVALVLANFGWWGAFTLTTVLTWVNISRPPTALPTTFQRVSGLFIILLMGIGIAAGLALSRMRLAESILRAFEEGYRASISNREPNFHRDNS